MNSLDPFPSQADIRSANGELLKRQRSVRHTSSDMAAFLVEVQAFVQRVQATGAVLDNEEERWDSQGLLDYWGTILSRAGMDSPYATLAEFDPTLAPELDKAHPPYLGLAAFRLEKRDLFFGRLRVIDSLVDKVHDERLLAVVGPSGSGKSSLVLAGLLPKLQEGTVPGSQAWHYYSSMVPGSHPLTNLARLLQPPDVDTAAWIEGQVKGFQQDTGSLIRLVSAQSLAPALLVVDQFEEVFTLCDDEQERIAFIGNLLSLTQVPGTRHTVILTMRSDYEPHVARLPALQKHFEQATVRVPPFDASELREAIEKPPSGSA